ncbi:MAG: hypothetical protein PVS3B3_07910 [Ktedonobacteraceae bacterium]
MVNMLKKLALSDILIVLVMGFLLYYGASWQIFTWYTDAGKYECYSTAFWHGVSALKSLPVPQIQCRFITHPLPGTNFITNDTLIQIMRTHNVPAWFVSFVAAQSPTQALHALPHEYPLLTIIPFSFGLVTSAHWYQVAFAISMILLAGIIYAMLRMWRSQSAAIAFALYMVVGCWATAGARYDVIPAGFTLGALLLAERRRWRWAYTLLAVATMFKFYPIVLVPAFLIAQHKSRYMLWHKWWKGPDVFVFVCAAITAVSLLLSVEGTLGPLSYFGDRPIQAESTAASILWVGSFFGFPLHYAATYGSLNMLSPLSSIVSPMMSLLLITGLAYVCWLQWRGKIQLSVSLMLMLLVVICTGKVFSPQYLLWIIPFVAYIGECNKRWLASWMGIGLLTTWIYPYIYSATKVFLRVPSIPTFNPVVFTRNALLISFLIVLLYHYSLLRKRVVISVEDMPQQADREAIASMAQAD